MNLWEVITAPNWISLPIMDVIDRIALPSEVEDPGSNQDDDSNG